MVHGQDIICVSEVCGLDREKKLHLWRAVIVTTDKNKDEMQNSNCFLRKYDFTTNSNFEHQRLHDT